MAPGRPVIGGAAGRGRFRRGQPRGLTLLELLLAMLLLSVVALAFSAFFRVVFKASLQSEIQIKGQASVRAVLNVLEMDIFDMNEVIYASPTRIDFLMDSHRAPWYDPAADTDGDGFDNLRDPDDDGDALDAQAPITRLRDLAVSISSVGWRQGFDMDDDDENGDGQRDVLCRYEYTPPGISTSGVLTRTFCFDGVCGAPTVVLDRGLRDFSFDVIGTPNALELPANVDVNYNGLIDRDDFDRLDGTNEGSPFPLLDQFMETRWITGIRVHILINPSDTFQAPTTIDTEINPPLLGIKRKYPS